MIYGCVSHPRMTTLSEVSNTDFCKTAKWAFERAADDTSVMVGGKKVVVAAIRKTVVTGADRELISFELWLKHSCEVEQRQMGFPHERK